MLNRDPCHLLSQNVYYYFSQPKPLIFWLNLTLGTTRGPPLFGSDFEEVDALYNKEPTANFIDALKTIPRAITMSPCASLIAPNLPTCKRQSYTVIPEAQ
jgi:hypothetical protein